MEIKQFLFKKQSYLLFEIQILFSDYSSIQKSRLLEKKNSLIKDYSSKCIVLWVVMQEGKVLG